MAYSRILESLRDIIWSTTSLLDLVFLIQLSVSSDLIITGKNRTLFLHIWLSFLLKHSQPIQYDDKIDCKCICVFDTKCMQFSEHLRYAKQENTFPFSTRKKEKQHTKNIPLLPPCIPWFQHLIPKCTTQNWLWKIWSCRCVAESRSSMATGTISILAAAPNFTSTEKHTEFFCQISVWQ